ncbi:MAG: alkaline phosphatase family protein [Candidatus Cybelea sp.]
MRAGAWLALALAGATAGCALRRSDAFLPAQSGVSQPQRAKDSPIAHVVLIVQENRTFNDFFATFPGADGTTKGEVKPNAQCGISKKETIPLQKMGLVTKLHGAPHDLTHTYSAYMKARDASAMDGFDDVVFRTGGDECRFPYQYTDPNDIKPYWQLARKYALAEHMFTTQGSNSFTAHQDLIAGDTTIGEAGALIDLPSCSGSQCVWGCDAPHGTSTSLITKDNVYKEGAGPFPCLTYPTLRNLLDAKKVSWRYYVPPICCSLYGRQFSAFDAIKAVRYGSEWTDGHIVSPQTKIIGDIKAKRLAGVTWIIPDEVDSDHPGTDSDSGPSWVANIVNTIGKSAYWKSTAIVIVWDDWGGLYDNLKPPQLGYGGLGFRVPALVVSAYAKPGYLSKTQYEFGGILHYIEDNWRLGTLQRSDKRAASIGDCFDYARKPIAFTPVAPKYPMTYFLERKPSYLPVDDDM